MWQIRKHVQYRKQAGEEFQTQLLTESQRASRWWRDVMRTNRAATHTSNSSHLNKCSSLIQMNEAPDRKCMPLRLVWCDMLSGDDRFMFQKWQMLQGWEENKLKLNCALFLDPLQKPHQTNFNSLESFYPSSISAPTHRNISMQNRSAWVWGNAVSLLL